MPGNTIAHKAAASRQINFPDAARVFNPHASTGNRVTEMRVMKMPLMSDTRWERAAQDSLRRIFMQSLTDWFALPARLQGVRK